MKWRVLITTPVIKSGDEVDRRLQEAGIETIFNPWRPGRTEDELINLVKGVDGVIPVGTDAFTQRVIESADRLRVISRPAAGYDTVDLPTATARGIPVCIAPGSNKRAVAEYAFGLMLQCARKLVENLSEVSRGGWTKHVGIDLGGRTLGIIGLGAIGKELAKRAKAFEMDILAYDVIQDSAFAEQYEVRYVAVEQLLRESDFISLHLFMCEENRHFINAERLAAMKPTAYLINVARGGVIDHDELYRALKEKLIAGAALDVHEPEPLPADSPLRTLDNVYLSPHAAASSVDARMEQGRQAAENLIMVLRGERPRNVVNTEVYESPKHVKG